MEDQVGCLVAVLFNEVLLVESGFEADGRADRFLGADVLFFSATFAVPTPPIFLLGSKDASFGSDIFHFY